MDFWSFVREGIFLLLLLENVREVNEKILLGLVIYRIKSPFKGRKFPP